MAYVIKEVLIKEEKQELIKFLKKFNLKYEEDINYSLLMYDDDLLIGTCSVSKNVLKDFAILEEYQGLSLTNKLVTRIINYLYDNGIYHYFVFTKSNNYQIFASLNMKTIAMTEELVLLEGGLSFINDKLDYIKLKYKIDDIEKGAVVVNTNPMTKGHLYLIETAAKKCNHLLVFVVSEDKSSFEFIDRFKIVKEALNHLDNITVLASTEYMVSTKTFPTYFLDDNDDISYLHAKLDATIFKEYFMPKFNITKRFVGTEPISHATNNYNKALKLILGDALEIIERLELDNNVISASYVRELLREDKLEEVKKYVVKPTYDFLISDKGHEVIKKLKENKNSRH